MPMIKIHQATKADIDVLRGIGCETYREHFSTIWSPAGMQDFLDQDFSVGALNQSIEAPHRHLWLIASDSGGKTVGFAKVNWSIPAPVTGGLGAELQKIYFLKSAAGNGYGKQLLQFIHDQALQRGQALLWLDVLKTNSNARGFYEAFGFKQIGEIPFTTDLAEIGMIVMSLQLKQPQAGK